MTTILLKRSTVSGTVPDPASLASGEVAINTADSKLFHKNASGAVVELGRPLDLTRAQIASRGISVASFTVSGEVAQGDSGAGALYVRGTAGGLRAVQDAAGTWWNLSLPNGVATPGWFGARCDGVTDDTVAMQACVTASASVVLPAATIILSAQITRAGALAIKGQGIRESRLVWTAAAASRGLKVNLGSVSGVRQTFQAADFSVITRGAAVGRGLEIIDSTPADRFAPSVVVSNVKACWESNPFGEGWASGIWMDGCQGAYLDKISIFGKIGSGGEPTYDSEHGIYYGNSSELSPHPTEFQVTNSQIKLVKKAIDGYDFEGLVASDNQIVGCNYGITASGPTTFPHVSIVNNHLNCSIGCVHVDRMQQVLVIGNLLYNQLASASGAFGVTLSGGVGFFTIAGNEYENLSAGGVSANGVVISSASDGKITGNTFRRTRQVGGTAAGTGIWLTSGATRVIVGQDNVFAASPEVETAVLDQGANNRVASAGFGQQDGIDGTQERWGSLVVTLDASGNGTITLEKPFKTAFEWASVQNGDPSFALGGSVFSVRRSACTTSQIAFAVAGAASSPVRVEFTAKGR